MTFVFTCNRAECEAVVKGFSGAVYKSFPSQHEAEVFAFGAVQSAPAPSRPSRPLPYYNEEAIFARADAARALDNPMPPMQSHAAAAAAHVAPVHASAAHASRAPARPTIQGASSSAPRAVATAAAPGAPVKPTSDKIIAGIEATADLAAEGYQGPDIQEGRVYYMVGWTGNW